MDRSITILLRKIRKEKAYLVVFEGSGTYLIKEELKYHGFRWNSSLKRWEKVYSEKKNAEDIVKYLKKFVEVENNEIEIFEKIEI